MARVARKIFMCYAPGMLKLPIGFESMSRKDKAIEVALLVAWYVVIVLGALFSYWVMFSFGNWDIA